MCNTHVQCLYYSTGPPVSGVHPVTDDRSHQFHNIALPSWLLHQYRKNIRTFIHQHKERLQKKTQQKCIGQHNLAKEVSPLSNKLLVLYKPSYTPSNAFIHELVLCPTWHIIGHFLRRVLPGKQMHWYRQPSTKRPTENTENTQKQNKLSNKTNKLALGTKNDAKNTHQNPKLNPNHQALVDL